ncbi:hypothetical protein HK102_013226 [Quaeritorhiza haematococci]|nr:hypothetical protein HK102_013226 [Quaeritorhiza haematococci]
MPSCMCPSLNPPGGLSPRNVPQFITLTLDDAITADNHPIIMQAMGNNEEFKNPNGCPVPATFFISTMYTDYALLQKTYNQGNEIAVHTMNHVGDPSVEEIEGSYLAVNAWGGVPKSEILGFRTPFLNYTTKTFERLRGLGTMLYDSSMTQNGANEYWPYTLDNGPASTCQTGTCDPGMKIPGLWEIPISNLRNEDGTDNSSLDPSPLPGTPQNGSVPDLTKPTRGEVVKLWQDNFNRHYNGNRAPFGVYLHVLWIARDRENRIAALREFIQWTLRNPDVYWVTNQQLLGWINNPTDIAGSRTNPALGCRTKPTGSNICDGVSNVAPEQCVWNDANVISGYYAFNTCFGCPSRPPNVTEPGPVPSKTSSRCFVPDQGCGNQAWDPVGCRCVDVSRLAGGVSLQLNLKAPSPIPSLIGRVGNTSTGGEGGNGASGQGKTSDADAVAVKMATSAVVVLMSLILALLL